MSDYVVPAPPQVGVAIKGSTELFPVRRIYCVGRNYAAHIREMGGDEREPPFFFQKPADAIVANGGVVPYPSLTADFQHEIELVLAIGGRGRDVSVAQAAALVYGVAVGLDLTRRDLQFKARDSGRPWEPGKSFDHSAPIGEIVPLSGGSLPSHGAIALRVNGVVKQQGDLQQLIWNCAEIVSELSKLFELFPGDLIYTGTPSGVGPVRVGDVLEGTIDGIGSLSITIG
jgi:fumarylpyruvate hydrolase